MLVRLQPRAIQKDADRLLDKWVDRPVTHACLLVLLDGRCWLPSADFGVRFFFFFKQCVALGCLPLGLEFFSFFFFFVFFKTVCGLGVPAFGLKIFFLFFFLFF